MGCRYGNLSRAFSQRRFQKHRGTLENVFIIGLDDVLCYVFRSASAFSLPKRWPISPLFRRAGQTPPSAPFPPYCCAFFRSGNFSYELFIHRANPVVRANASRKIIVPR